VDLPELRSLAARAASVAAVVAVAAALAGCGTNPVVSFRDGDFHQLQLRIDQQKSQISGQLQVVRLGHKRDARAVGALVDQLSGTVSAMAALKAPSSIQKNFRRYVHAQRRLVVALRRFAVLLGHRSRHALDRQATVVQSAAGAIVRTRDALDAQMVEAK
jgi:hypothetical protein